MMVQMNVHSGAGIIDAPVLLMTVTNSGRAIIYPLLLFQR